MEEKRRTKRVTTRFDAREHAGLIRLAAFLGESQSTTVRRVIRAVTQNLDLLANLEINDQKQETFGEAGESRRGQQVAVSDAARLITALLTAYREAGSTRDLPLTGFSVSRLSERSNAEEEDL